MRRSLLAATISFISIGLATAAPTTMQGVRVGQGGTLSVAEFPVPKPSAGEVLIQARAAGVNPVDWKIAGGRVGQVPGIDVSGVIDSLGEGVTGWKVGDAVLGF